MLAAHANTEGDGRQADVHVCVLLLMKLAAKKRRRRRRWVYIHMTSLHISSAKEISLILVEVDAEQWMLQWHWPLQEVILFSCEGYHS